MKCTERYPIPILDSMIFRLVRFCYYCFPTLLVVCACAVQFHMRGNGTAHTLEAATWFYQNVPVISN